MAEREGFYSLRPRKKAGRARHILGVWSATLSLGLFQVSPSSDLTTIAPVHESRKAWLADVRMPVTLVGRCFSRVKLFRCAVACGRRRLAYRRV